MNNKILLLHSFKGNFYTKWNNTRKSRKESIFLGLNIELIKKNLESKGYQVLVSNFENLDLTLDYRDVFVIYHSSEDLGFNYRSFIEDKLTILNKLGAILIPEYSYMKAHGNKCMMELLRDSLKDDKFKTIKSKSYSLPESIDFEQIKYPLILKSYDGAGSINVYKVNNKKELIKISRKISKNPLYEVSFNHIFSLLKSYISIKFLHNKPGTSLESYNYDRNMKKFLIQNYIPNLDGDYKVLIYGDKYYVLKRKNRPGDFRASGSGLFTYPKLDEIINILNYCKDLKDEFNTPWISIDVANKDSIIHLIEFQFISFGTYTFINSDRYFKLVENQWREIMEEPNLEETFVYALDQYICNNYKYNCSKIL